MESYLLHDANASSNFKNNDDDTERRNERIRYLLDDTGVS